MDGFKSAETVKKNAAIWAKNLPKTARKHRRNLPRTEDLEGFTRLPLKKDVLGRYHTLLDEEKSKKKRVDAIFKELTNLWKKMSFPMLSQQAITSRIGKLIEDYEKNQKYPKNDFEKQLDTLFDITKVEGLWLCEEDKKLYHKQKESEGKIGYTTHRPAPISSIHPSKRKRFSKLSISEEERMEAEEISDSSISESSSSDSEFDVPSSVKTKHCTSISAKLVNELSISTHKASKVCKKLSDEGVSLPTPSQSGTFKGMVRLGEEQKKKITNYIKENPNFCLHFDGKRLTERKGKVKYEEYQVVCLQNFEKEVKLGIVKCKSGSAEDIFNGISTILDDFNAWACIKMIICDTTAVNTGHINGVVTRIKRKMLQMGLDNPQYIGCQHHILDRILKHVLDFYFKEHTVGPNMNYSFIEEVIENYGNLKQSYSYDYVMQETENPGWRDDFKFLFILCTAFQSHKRTGKFPFIKYGSLPSIHSARWNSRAIYCLLAYFLLPKWREMLEVSVSFIASGWQEAWFSDQKFHTERYNNLLASIKKTKCKSAEKCFITHWSKENSIVDVPRSNMIAERNIKLMEELRETCKTDKYLSLKFISKTTL